jgi:VWFA-related protein
MLPRLIFIVAAWNLFAQEPVIRLDVRHVLVPVVVTDKKGHHVSGLRSSDFRISEDGVPQEIASFSSDTTSSVDDVAALSKPVSAIGPRHTFVICVDTLHASSANAGRIREALENLFEKEKPADAQYVLIDIGRQLQVLQAATSSPLAILLKLRSTAFQNAMAGLDASALSAQLQSLRTRMDDFCKRCACGNRSGQGSCNSEMDTLKQSIDADAERWTAPTFSMLEQFKSVVEELAKLPTGRTLILVSEGFNINPKREFYQVVSAYLPNVPQFKLDDSKDLDPGLHEALKVATERGVIIDTVDPRGSATASLASTGSMDASAPSGASGDYSMLGTNRSNTRSPRNVATQNADAKANPFPSQESVSMVQLARATGGVYFHNSSDLLKQFRSAIADGREYYVLSYVPKNSARDGKFRTIRVETSDAKLTVRAKSGYWAAQ